MLWSIFAQHFSDALAKLEQRPSDTIHDGQQRRPSMMDAIGDITRIERKPSSLQEKSKAALLLTQMLLCWFADFVSFSIIFIYAATSESRYFQESIGSIIYIVSHTALLLEGVALHLHLKQLRRKSLSESEQKAAEITDDVTFDNYISTFLCWLLFCLSVFRLSRLDDECELQESMLHTTFYQKEG